MSIVIIDEEGKVPIPDELRNQLDLQPGTKIKVIVKKNYLIIHKVIDASEYERIADELTEKLRKANTHLEFEKIF